MQRAHLWNETRDGSLYLHCGAYRKGPKISCFYTKFLNTHSDPGHSGRISGTSQVPSLGNTSQKKKPHVRENFSPAILGPENGCEKTSMATNFLVLGKGGGIFGVFLFWGGGSANFFLSAEIFMNKENKLSREGGTFRSRPLRVEDRHRGGANRMYCRPKAEEGSKRGRPEEPATAPQSKGKSSWLGCQRWHSRVADFFVVFRLFSQNERF